MPWTKQRETTLRSPRLVVINVNQHSFFFFVNQHSWWSYLTQSSNIYYEGARKISSPDVIHMEKKSQMWFSLKPFKNTFIKIYKLKYSEE